MMTLKLKEVSWSPLVFRITTKTALSKYLIKYEKKITVYFGICFFPMDLTLSWNFQAMQLVLLGSVRNLAHGLWIISSCLLICSTCNAFHRSQITFWKTSTIYMYLSVMKQLMFKLSSPRSYLRLFDAFMSIMNDSYLGCTGQKHVTWNNDRPSTLQKNKLIATQVLRCKIAVDLVNRTRVFFYQEGRKNLKLKISNTSLIVWFLFELKNIYTLALRLYLLQVKVWYWTMKGFLKGQEVCYECYFVNSIIRIHDSEVNHHSRW